MAATSAALKFGSVVKEVAICSTKFFGTFGESFLGSLLLESLLVLEFVKSSVTTFGADEIGDAKQGIELRLALRVEPEFDSNGAG